MPTVLLARGPVRIELLPRGLRWQVASISLEVFPVEPERLAEVVAACARVAERRREIGTNASLAWLEDGVPPRESATLSAGR